MVGQFARSPTAWCTDAKQDTVRPRGLKECEEIQRLGHAKLTRTTHRMGENHTCAFDDTAVWFTEWQSESESGTYH